MKEEILKTRKLKVFEMFAGYGGASFGLQNAGIEHESVGFSEIEPCSIKCYAQNHIGVKNSGDCYKIKTEDLPDFDILTGGFPCQSFSIAGKREGFKAKKKGQLFFEIIRIAKDKKPKYMLLENVQGLISHDNGNTLSVVLQELRVLGYGVEHKLLYTKDYGIPQNRPRIWFACKLGGWELGEFSWPKKEKTCESIWNILEKEVDHKYYLKKDLLETLNRIEVEKGRTKILQSDGLFQFRYDKGLVKADTFTLMANFKPNDLSNMLFIRQPQKSFIGGYRYDKGIEILSDKNVCSTLTAAKNQIIIGDFRYDEGIRVREDEISPTLTTNNNTITNFSITTFRSITPKECWRLMGFKDGQINVEGMTDRQQYFMSGNGWDINVASLIWKQMLTNKFEKRGLFKLL